MRQTKEITKTKKALHFPVSCPAFHFATHLRIIQYSQIFPNHNRHTKWI